jgi:hypothetical protein
MTETVPKCRVRIESYLYNGWHRHYRHATKTFDRTYVHYCWRYRIVCNGLTVYRRGAFCDYRRCWESAERALIRVKTVLA